MAGDVVSFGPFRLFKTERLLLQDGSPVPIGGRALDLLIALTDRPGEVLSARELLGRVWSDVIVEPANLRVHIAALRKALGDGKEARYVVTVQGRGYSFVAPVQRDAGNANPPIAVGATAIPPPNFPGMPQLLVGRGEVIEAVGSLLLSRRFVSIVGSGGVGKTTVAIAVAHAIRQQLRDVDVCLVDLGSLTDPAQVSSATAAALGCQVQAGDPEPYIRAFIARKRLLIVLDNCEHVIEMIAPLAERLLRGAPSIYLLATSREALRVEGETVYQLRPLDSPTETMPSAAASLASPAVQLFMERAALSGHQGELNDDEAPIVSDICRRLDGIALAIELVASRAGTYGIHGTANLMTAGAQLAIQGRRAAMPRHQTLQAMLDWSFKLLLADEQRVLSRLSVFVGQFTLEMAQAVAGDADGDTQALTQAIFSLADKSLIQISSSGLQFRGRLLETTRVYAAAKLAEDGETEVILRRHACHFAAFLSEEVNEGMDFKALHVASFDPQLGNIRRALAWSFSDAGDRAVGIRLAVHAAPLLLAAGLHTESRKWCVQALGALHDPDRNTSPELILQVTFATASMYAGSDSGQVRMAIEHGLKLSEILNDERCRCRLLGDLIILLSRMGDFNAALNAAEQRLAVAQSMGDVAEEATAEWLLAATHHFAGGDHAATLHHCERGIALASGARGGAAGARGYNLQTRGVATRVKSFWLLGFQDQGVKSAYEAIQEAYSEHLLVTSCVILIHATQVLVWSGEFEDALQHAEAVLGRAREYALAPYVASSLSLKGEVMLARGQVVEGVEAMRDALKAMSVSQYNILVPSASRALAEGLVLSGHAQEALFTIDKAVAATNKSGAKVWIPELLRTRGQILLAQPNPNLTAAEAVFLSAIDEARRQHALSWELKAAVPFAAMLRDQGRSAEARSILGGIYDRFSEGFGRPDLVSARKLLDTL